MSDSIRNGSHRDSPEPSRRDFLKTAGTATTVAASGALISGVPRALHAVLVRDAGSGSPALQPTRLRCEHLDTPLGIDEQTPRLSWIVTSAGRGMHQAAYQIVAAASESALRAGKKLLWDSGKVPSDATQVVYAGPALHSGERIWWMVRTWDQHGQASVWSPVSWWEMALLDPQEWHGTWIALNEETSVQPLPLLRRTFTLDAAVKRARLYVTGLGYYEASVNGKRIGSRHLDPGYTRYDRRVLYATYDVTDALHDGKNAIGLMLGNGWYNVQELSAWEWEKAPWRASPRALAELRVELANGKTVTVASDTAWKTIEGPITFSCLYGGETYDARNGMPGWNTAAFDDSAWHAVKTVEAPHGKLVAQAMYPIADDHLITPTSIHAPKEGRVIVDIGQNLAGCAKLTVRGKPGQKVTIRYGERITPQGLIDQERIAEHVKRFGENQRFQTDEYICKGTGTETWQSRFAYHGFRYVDVEGADVARDTIRAQFMHSAVPSVGHFTCSNPLLNRIWENARWSYLSNFYGIPTDCPQREKNGWTGDAQLACELGLLNYDGLTVYEKWMNDISDGLMADGNVPSIVPTGGWGEGRYGASTAWSEVFILIPYYLHLYYGDSRALERHYEKHCRHIEFLNAQADHGIISSGRLGDFLTWNAETPTELPTTAYYYMSVSIVADTAKMLGKTDDEKKYRDLAAQIRDAFITKFYNASAGTYGNGSQTSLSCALFFGLIAPEARAKVAENLVASVKQSNDHLDTGVLGARYILHALTEAGHADVAYRIVTQETPPGWGYWVKQGATTMWEDWKGEGSLNHIFFGDVAAWFVRGLAGINPDPMQPGFKHIIIKPNPVGDLTSASASYDSVRGRVASEWTRKGGTLTLKVSIPANSTATVYVPARELAHVQEGGRAIGAIPDVRVDDGRVVVPVGGGEYTFTVKA